MFICFCFLGGGLRSEVVSEADPMRHEQRAEISESSQFSYSTPIAKKCSASFGQQPRPTSLTQQAATARVCRHFNLVVTLLVPKFV